ncbi:hypothetical protein EDD17DRAFT_1532910 [Pisolithus thermaeus]|nr:hypothetical protein EV401DRAFT_1910218 [Pisolithus croceorrhizus]KAI6168249.1 hypothetical protein EDD17DRAFT_1532910 [Pisolithus thermaeus]
MEKVHTVTVLGASYGRFRAAQLLATSVLNRWRVILVERNTSTMYTTLLSWLFAPI